MHLESGVDVDTIDFALFLQRLPKPARLIKIDIEGAEAVLRSVINCYSTASTRCLSKRMSVSTSL
jgi:hypothetical protein